MKYKNLLIPLSFIAVSLIGCTPKTTPGVKYKTPELFFKQATNLGVENCYIFTSKYSSIRQKIDYDFEMKNEILSDSVFIEAEIPETKDERWFAYQLHINDYGEYGMLSIYADGFVLIRHQQFEKEPESFGYTMNKEKAQQLITIAENKVKPSESSSGGVEL